MGGYNTKDLIILIDSSNVICPAARLAFRRSDVRPEGIEPKSSEWVCSRAGRNPYVSRMRATFLPVAGRIGCDYAGCVTLENR